MAVKAATRYVDHMRTWKPQPGNNVWIAFGLLIVCVGLLGWLGLPLAIMVQFRPETWPIDLRLFGRVLLLLLLLALASTLLYRALAALTLRYGLDRNGLYISWLGNRAVVPLSQIETVDLGATLISTPLGPLQQIGYFWGRALLRGGKSAQLFSTRPPAQSLVVHTSEAAYLIAPQDTTAFVQDLEQRRSLGATQTLTATVESGRIFRYEYWNDRFVRLLLLLALGMNALLFGVLAARYPGLPELVQFRYSPTGAIAELRPRHQTLFLPLAALALTLLNTAIGVAIYHTQRPGARLLQVASVILQLLFGVALLAVLH